MKSGFKNMNRQDDMKRPRRWIFLLLSLFGLSSASVDDITITATLEQITAFCGTGDVKLVFINKPFGEAFALCYVDYTTVTSGLPEVREIPAASGAILPSVSGSGNYIVYAVGPSNDGMPAASAAYLCGFDTAAAPAAIKAGEACQPRFLQNTEPLTVIYTTQDGFDNIYDGVGQTMKMAVPDGAPSGIEETVYAGGSYIGGLSWNGRFLVTAYPEGRILDLNAPGSPSRQLHVVSFNSPSTGHDSVVASQVCNASVSSSRIDKFNNAMMYVDFGYPFMTGDYRNMNLGGGEPYDSHQLIFIGDSDNRVLKSYRSPPAEGFNDPGTISSLVWDDPEWSNHPYYAAAALHAYRTGGTANREGVSIINLKDSTYLQVALAVSPEQGGTANLQWPWVWIDVPDGFQEDSTWLDYEEHNVSVGPGQYAKPGKVFFTIISNMLLSEQLLESVDIITLQGGRTQLLIPTTGKTSVELPSIPNGLYFIRLRTVVGAEAVIKWAVAR
ncbi:hypothetical protein ACFL5V_12195 [Fibrobacterota bacterium]